MKYTTLITKSKEETAAALAPARAAEQKAALGLKISKLSLDIQRNQTKVEAIKASYPVDFDAIVAALDEVALQDRSLSQLKSIDDELFTG